MAGIPQIIHQIAQNIASSPTATDSAANPTILTSAIGTGINTSPASDIDTGKGAGKASTANTNTFSPTPTAEAGTGVETGVRTSAVPTGAASSTTTKSASTATGSNIKTRTAVGAGAAHSITGSAQESGTEAGTGSVGAKTGIRIETGVTTGVGTGAGDDRHIDVLYLSAFIGDVGATIAAYRIHSGLRARGINSHMLVMYTQTEARDYDQRAVHIAVPKHGEKYGLGQDMAPLRRYPRAGWYATGTAGMDISEHIERFDPKIVQLHFINYGFLTIEGIGRIDRKIVWRLPDCWPFTGGCCYNQGCQKHRDECGDCPQLYSDDRYDMSHHIWMRKEKAFRNLDMTIVAPTKWMEREARASSLFRDREIVVIPNGLDPDEYRAVDKSLARRALGIPQERKIILYGAANALSDHRKGFDLLRTALEKLAPKHRNEYFLLIFGAGHRDIGLEMPVKFIGYQRDRDILRLAYSATDVMVVPSREEAFGQTVIEAMACSRPVVSFLNTGPDCIIDHRENGYLARFLDPDDMADGIEWVLADEERMERMGRNARRKVETTYDIKIVARQYQTLYDRLLKQ